MLERLKQWAKELKAQLLVLWFARSHPDMPLIAKVSAVLVVAYAFSPIDLIPDFIPVLGYLDDIIIVPIGIYVTLWLVPPHVIADSRQRADEWMAANREKPKNYLAGALILLVWLLCAYWAWTLFAEWFE